MNTTPSASDSIPGSGDPLTRDRVQALAERSVRRGLTTGFQALLVAVIEVLVPLPPRARAAGQAALSLAQQERMATLTQEVEASLDALRAGLSEHGRRLLPLDRQLGERLRDAFRLRSAAAPLAWSDACAEVATYLHQTAAHLESLVYAQPPDSSAFLLGAEVVAHLRAHQQRVADLLPPDPSASDGSGPGSGEA
jgi:hypothetical protein